MLPTGPIARMIIAKAFELTIGLLADEAAVKKYRREFRDYMRKLVADTSNPWDDRGAEILFKVLGYTEDELK